MGLREAPHGQCSGSTGGKGPGRDRNPVGSQKRQIPKKVDGFSPKLDGKTKGGIKQMSGTTWVIALNNAAAHRVRKWPGETLVALF